MIQHRTSKAVMASNQHSSAHHQVGFWIAVRSGPVGDILHGRLTDDVSSKHCACHNEKLLQEYPTLKMKI